MTPPTPLPISLIPTVLAFTIALLLSACASNGPSIASGSFPPSSFESFLNGQIRLECKLSCAGKFGLNLPEMHNLYTTEKWNSLSSLVMEIGENMNIAYYYLGRAAEGLGKPKAAETYYLLSDSSPHVFSMDAKAWFFRMLPEKDLPDYN